MRFISGCILFSCLLVACFGQLVPDDYGTESVAANPSYFGADDVELVDVGPATMSGPSPSPDSLSPVDYPDTPSSLAASGQTNSRLYSDDYVETAASKSTGNVYVDDYGESLLSPSLSPAKGQDTSTDYGTGALSPVEYPDINTETKIINGVIVPDNEFNYIVSLRSGGRHICGGSILEVADRKTIITAAHCVHSRGAATPAHQLSVAVGIRRLSSATTASIIPVSQVIVHPAWNEDAILNDIAVLRLERGAVASGASKVTAVKLPPPNRAPDPGHPLIAAGWGKTKQGLQQGAASDVLLQATLKIVDRQRCSQAIGRGAIPESQICTENQQAGTCKGDSGGPLINRRPDGDYLVGLTSYGMPACDLGTADAFTKVSHFTEWINGVANGQAPGAVPSPSPVPGGGVVPSPAPGDGGIGAPAPVPGADCGCGGNVVGILPIFPGIIAASGPTGSCLLTPLGMMCRSRGATSGGVRCRKAGRSLFCVRSRLYAAGQDTRCFNYEGRRYCPKS